MIMEIVGVGFPETVACAAALLRSGLATGHLLLSPGMGRSAASSFLEKFTRRGAAVTLSFGISPGLFSASEHFRDGRGAALVARVKERIGERCISRPGVEDLLLLAEEWVDGRPDERQTAFGLFCLHRGPQEAARVLSEDPAAYNGFVRPRHLLALKEFLGSARRIVREEKSFVLAEGGRSAHVFERLLWSEYRDVAELAVTRANRVFFVRCSDGEFLSDFALSLGVPGIENSYGDFPNARTIPGVFDDERFAAAFENALLARRKRLSFSFRPGRGIPGRN
jgi:hypothetical protein